MIDHCGDRGWQGKQVVVGSRNYHPMMVLKVKGITDKLIMIVDVVQYYWNIIVQNFNNFLIFCT